MSEALCSSDSWKWVAAAAAVAAVQVQYSTRTHTILSKPEALTEPTFSPTTTVSTELSSVPKPPYVINFFYVFIWLLGFICLNEIVSHNIADDPFGDPKVIGDPYCTLFVGRLSHLTTEDTLLKVYIRRLCCLFVFVL